MILENDPPIDIVLPETAPLMPPAVETMPTGAVSDEALVEIELGDLIYARSGDKGANANLGVWARSPQAWEWLRGNLATDELHVMLGLAATVTVERYELANVHGLIFVLKGYFGTSGSGNIGLDQIGKALGEFLRARHVRVPARLAA
jgi:hypothetical protein